MRMIVSIPLIDESWRLLSRGWVLDDLFMYCKNIQEHHSALEYQNILFFTMSEKDRVKNGTLTVMDEQSEDTEKGKESRRMRRMRGNGRKKI